MKSKINTDMTQHTDAQLKQALMRLEKDVVVDNLVENLNRLILSNCLLHKAVDVALALQRAHRQGNVNGVHDLIEELGDVVDLVAEQINIGSDLLGGISLLDGEGG
jgi:hypothetical protein